MSLAVNNQNPVALMRDALGNVVRTESIYGGANFRYTAYGQLIKSTQGYPNYGFGWVGTLGYRETNLADASHYVRARHYSNQQSRWATVDPLWPRELGYGYVKGSPIRFPDPTSYQLLDPFPIEEPPFDLGPFGGPTPIPNPVPFPSPAQPPFPYFPYFQCRQKEFEAYCDELHYDYKKSCGGGRFGPRPKKYTKGIPIDSGQWYRSCRCCDGRTAFYNAGCDPADKHSQARNEACLNCASWDNIFYGPREPYQYPGPPWMA